MTKTAAAVDDGMTLGAALFLLSPESSLCSSCSMCSEVRTEAFNVVVRGYQVVMLVRDLVVWRMLSEDFK